MAYPTQTVGSSTSGQRQQYPATSGLLSADLWANPRGAIALRANRPKNDTRSPPFTFDFHHAKDPGKELPDELVRLYPDLDNDSRNFLKHGPRSPAEKLAYAQQVDPLAHLDAELAAQDVQQRFQDTGELEDTGRFFAGPDARVYIRNSDSVEQLGARIRRGYEQAIGGFDEPTIKESLGNISEATRSKRADVELYNPPTLPEQAERERLLAEYQINPEAWQSGIRADEEAQEVLRENGYVWDAIFPWSYVGPDGALYYKTELTEQDPFTAYHNARERWEREQYLKTLPEPSVGELQFRAATGGGYLPGGHQANHRSLSGKFVRPGSLEAGVQIRARLADIPRLAALYGWKQAPQPEDDHVANRGSVSKTGAQTPKNAEATVAQAIAENAPRKKRKRTYFTRAGVRRDKTTKVRDWKAFIEGWDRLGYGDLISLSNRLRLKERHSPVVDDNWIAYHPEDAGLRGEVIDIHHVFGELFKQPLPVTRHRNVTNPKSVGYSAGGIGGQAPYYSEPPPERSK